MSQPRSRSRSAPRRTSRTASAPRTASTPRTAPRRGSGPAGTSTATLDRAEPEVIAAVAEAPPAAPVAPRPPATPSSGSRRDRRRQRPRAPRHRLLLACTAVLALGLIGVLLLNTIISQGAFRQHELEIDLILTAEEEESLARAVQEAEAPIEVERKARALGMVPAAAPVFLRLSDGEILGEPVPAPKPTGPVDFKGAPGIQPTPRPTPRASATEDAGGDATATPGVDPATVIDPALDPSTGLDPGPAASPEPVTSPEPATQEVNP
jgi:hypothetical protein